jgi:hypothetical protein
MTRAFRFSAAAIALSAALLVSGCASSSNQAATMPSVVMPVPAPGYAYDAGVASVADMAVGGAGSGSGESGLVTGSPMEVPGAVSETDREIIVFGSLELVADDPIATSSQVAAYVESIGGTVSSRNEWRGTPNRPGNASLSVRIPAGKLNSAVESLRDFGEVRAIWLNQTDVTAQAIDLDARIEALQISVARLTQLLATAGDTGDLLQVERELSHRQADLDALRANRADLTNRVQMSTLDININPTPEAEREAEPYQGFVGGLHRGWQAFVAFTRGLAVAAGILLPWLITLGALAALVTALVKAWRKRAAKRREGRTIGYVEEPGMAEQSHPVRIFTEDDA